MMIWWGWNCATKTRPTINNKIQNKRNEPSNKFKTNKRPTCLLTHWSQLFIGKAPELRDQKGINQPIINNNTLNKQETDLSEEKQATIKHATNKQPIKWKEQNLPEGPGWLGLIVGQQARRGQSSPKSPCRARSAWPGYNYEGILQNQ